ncbi:MAG TPA: ACT domain-containing protein [Candidatus Aquicultor sp.]|jgi:hypothetical protein
MKVIQLSIFLENKKGRLAEVTKVLGDNDVNIRALFIADTSDFGILRIIVDRPGEAYDILKNNEFTVSKNEVVAVKVPDEPGGLSKVLHTLDANDLNIEYLYCFVDKDLRAAIDIMRFDDIERAVEVLQREGIKLLSSAELSNM